MLERRLTPRPLGRSAKRLDMDVDLALFVLVAFSIYTGCATTNTYRVNIDSKNPSDLVGKYVHVHHDMKERERAAPYAIADGSGLLKNEAAQNATQERLIPNFLILLYSVEGGTPSRAAAPFVPLICPLVVLSTSRI